MLVKLVSELSWTKGVVFSIIERFWIVLSLLSGSPIGLQKRSKKFNSFF